MFFEHAILALLLVVSAAGSMTILGYRLHANKRLKPIVARRDAIYDLTDGKIECLSIENKDHLQRWQRKAKWAVIGAYVSVMLMQSLHYQYPSLYAFAQYIVMLCSLFFVAAIGRCSIELGACLGMKHAFLPASDAELTVLHRKLSQGQRDRLLARFIKAAPKQMRTVHVMAIEHLIMLIERDQLHE
jgi:hypothetical protein